MAEQEGASTTDKRVVSEEACNLVERLQMRANHLKLLNTPLDLRTTAQLIEATAPNFGEGGAMIDVVVVMARAKFITEFLAALKSAVLVASPDPDVRLSLLTMASFADFVRIYDEHVADVEFLPLYAFVSHQTFQLSADPEAVLKRLEDLEKATDMVNRGIAHDIVGAIAAPPAFDFSCSHNTQQLFAPLQKK